MSYFFYCVIEIDLRLTHFVFDSRRQTERQDRTRDCQTDGKEIGSKTGLWFAIIGLPDDLHSVNGAPSTTPTGTTGATHPPIRGGGGRCDNEREPQINDSYESLAKCLMSDDWQDDVSPSHPALEQRFQFAAHCWGLGARVAE